MEETEFQQNVIRLLESIKSTLDRVEIAIQTLLKTEHQTLKEKKVPLDVEALLDLPLHLKDTAQVVITKGSATAKEVAAVTGKSRAAESDYLNQLVKMGHVSRKRQGRTVYFYV